MGQVPWIPTIVSADQLEAIFPALRQGGYAITSEQADFPNCIGWALHSNLYFEPELSRFIGGYYWPEGVRRDDSVAAWIQLFELHGYRTCRTAEPEPGEEKVAIYADEHGVSQHVARQLASGEWTSKLGKLEDIQHRTLDVLAGKDYGQVTVVMKRQRT